MGIEKRKCFFSALRINKSVLLRVLISIMACIYLVNKVDWSQFVEQLRELQFAYVLFAFFSVLACIFISAYKWFILCRVNGNVTFLQCFRWYYIGFFFNNFLPGSIGGDVSRVIYASRVLDSQQAVASVSVERLFAGIALIFSTTTVIFTVTNGASLLGQTGIFILLIGVFLAFLFYEPIENKMVSLFGDKVRSFYEAIHQYKRKKYVLWELILYSLLFQLFFVLVTSFLFKAMGVSVPFLAQIGFVSIISIVTMLPISINGIGVREGTYAYLFSFLGVAEFVSITVSILFFVLVLLGTSIGGLFWITEKTRGG